MKIICKECGCCYFEIEEKDECLNCINNGAYLENEDGSDWNYIYDEQKIKDNNLKRTQCEDEGECKLGTTYNEGCYIYTCINCGYQIGLCTIFY